ncbi:ABC transporter substrate-binding protein [Arthrobacter sp. SD76]|uniref:ABC transporter substrate-binding protein n=1 Tax=Arthrobacter sp. SD76 TaxID=3415007 RepID=UPI003C72DCDA
MASFDPSNILFDRNEDYWQEDKPVVDHLRLTSYNSDQSATLAFTKGDVDWIGISGDPAQFESADPEHLVAWTPSFMTSFMIFNTTQAPFDNALVRKALSMALNRDQIVQAATQGTSKVAHPTGLVLPNMESWLDPEFADLAYEQDLDEALALFKEAGYEQDSDGRLLTPEGQQFGFSILSSSGFTQDVTQGQVIKDQLGKLGIAVNLELVPQEEATSRGETGDFQVAFGNSGQFDPMPGNVYNNLLNSSFAAPIGTETRGNYGRWKDPETDALLQKYRTAESDEARREAVQDIQQIMVDEVPIAPIYYQNAMSETSSREVTGWPGEDDPYSAGTFVLGPWASLIVSRLELAD